MKFATELVLKRGLDRCWTLVLDLIRCSRVSANRCVSKIFGGVPNHFGMDSLFTFSLIGLTLILAVPPAAAECQGSASVESETPDREFVDTGKGTVLHIPTGLIWKRCVEGQDWNGSTCTGIPLTFTWMQTFLRAIVVNDGTQGWNADQSDWRVPNVRELLSIVDYACGDTALNLRQFPAPPFVVWSSSQRVGQETEKWFVGLRGAFVTGKWDATISLRLVRSGAYPASFDAMNAPATPVQPQDGLWVIDAENNGQSGRGFQIETRSGTTVFTYFGYRAGGHGHWYLATGSFGKAGVTANLTQYHGGTSLGGSYQPAGAAGTAGTLAMSFGTPTRGSLTLPAEGTKSISKFVFNGPVMPSVVPINGLWVINAENNGQSGRGFQIEQHGGTVVFTYYGYDAAGNETWYLASGTMNGNSFTGTLTEYGGGTLLGQPYAAATATGSPGSVTIVFASPTTGTITLPGESAKAISKFVW